MNKQEECEHEVPVFGCESCIAKYAPPEDVLEIEDEMENEDDE